MLASSRGNKRHVHVENTSNASSTKQQSVYLCEEKLLALG